MSATRVLWYVPCSNTGLSQHGDPVFPHFCPLNQDLCWDNGGGGYCTLYWMLYMPGIPLCVFSLGWRLFG